MAEGSRPSTELRQWFQPRSQEVEGVPSAVLLKQLRMSFSNPAFSTTHDTDKMVKWIERIEFIESETQIGDGQGGKNEDDEYFDLLPNI